MHEQPGGHDGATDEEKSAEPTSEQPSLPDLTPRSFSWQANPSKDDEARSALGSGDLSAPDPGSPVNTARPPEAHKESPVVPERPEEKKLPVPDAPEPKPEATAAWHIPDRPVVSAPTKPVQSPGTLGGIQPLAGATPALRQPEPPAPSRVAATSRAGAEAYRTPRRVRRTIKHVEPWSILKVSVLFYLAMTLVFLLFTVIVFYIGVTSGVVGNFETLIRGIGWPTFRLRAVQVFRAVLLFGVLMSIFWSAVNVFMALIYNLVSDVIGGVQVQVSERD